MINELTCFWCHWTRLRKIYDLVQYLHSTARYVVIEKKCQKIPQLINNIKK